MNLKTKAKKTVLITVLSVLAALILLFVILRFRPQKAVDVVPVINICLNWEPDSMSFNGEVSSESYQAVAYSKDRPVEEVLVKDGDHVKIGDPLYRYDATSDNLNLELKKSQIEKLGYEIEDGRKEYKKLTKKNYVSTLPTPSPLPKEESIKKTAGIRSAWSGGPVLLNVLGKLALFDTQEIEDIPSFSYTTIIEWVTNPSSYLPGPFEWEETESKMVDGEKEETIYIYQLTITNKQMADIHKEKNYKYSRNDKKEEQLKWNGEGTYFDLFKESEKEKINFDVKEIPLGFIKDMKQTARNKIKDDITFGAAKATLRSNDEQMGSIYLTLNCVIDGEEPPVPTPGPTKEEKLEKAQELAKKIRDAEVQKKQLELDVQKLLLTGMDGYVRSEINGVVTAVKDPADVKNGGALLAVKGNGGYYVRCTIDENRLEKVKEGTRVTGMVYETGVECTGTVQEISLVPLSNSGRNYEYGMSATSTYAMRIKVDDNEKLTPGQYVEFKLESETGKQKGLYLQEAYVRNDGDSSYIYIDNNGVLKKQDVQVGKNYYGYVEILESSITTKDHVAFPYGKNVVDGAKTKIAE